jgi:hypothetical protein
MPAHTRWSGEHLWNLLHLTWDEFHAKYPDVKKNTWKGKRGFWRKKIMSGETVSPQEPAERIAKSWDVSAFNRETNEWETKRNYSYDHLAEEVTWQAEAAIITPNRRKPVKRDYESIFVFSDAQIGYRNVLNRETGQSEHIPIHDERKMATARQLADAIRPNKIINLGDTIDLAEFSRFDPDSDHFNNGTFEHALQRVHDMYAEYRSDHPDAEIEEVSSNRNERFNNVILKKFPQAYNVRRANDTSAYPVMSYPYMANLEHVRVNFAEGYPVGEHIIPRIGRAALRFAHGTETSSGMSSAASKAMKAHPETNNFQGHDHKDSEAWHTLLSGEQVGTWVIGALCNSMGLVPGRNSAVTSGGEPVRYQQNWTSSVAEIRLYEDGEMEVNRIMINADGTARYDGKVYGHE